MKLTQFVPRLGPWWMRYGDLDRSGIMVTASRNEVTISGGLKGHRGWIFGIRWRNPADTQWEWKKTFPRSARW